MDIGSKRGRFVALGLALAVVLAMAGPAAAMTRTTEATPTPQPTGAPTTGTPLDKQAIEKALGQSGHTTEDGVFVVDLPLEGFTVTVGSVTLAPGMAGGEADFLALDNEALLTGEVALAEPQVNPVVTAMQQNGLVVTAVHNHLFTTPPLIYVHFTGRGQATELATALMQSIDAGGQAMNASPVGQSTNLWGGTLFGNSSTTAPTATPTATPAGSPTPSDTPPAGVDTSAVESIIGQQGMVTGGAFEVPVPRNEQITLGGVAVPPSMGVESTLYFQSDGAGGAAVQGELVLLAGEVNEVIRNLRASGFQVMALHNHWLDDNPRLFYLHVWNTGDSATLAKALRAALDLTNSEKAGAATPQPSPSATP